MALSRDDVISGFRFILGRDPESEQVIEAHRLESYRHLRAVLLKSSEFRETYPKEFPLAVLPKETSRTGS